MHQKLVNPIMIVGIVTSLAGKSGAEVPAPPVNQSIGMMDVLIGDFTEVECRVCHATGVPDRHHMLFGQPIVPGSLVPYPDGDGDGTPDATYGCLNCHDSNFTVVRDCVVCHTSSPHHTTQAAQAGDCVSCHGEIVDNFNDGHYIPTYAESLITPAVDGGCGLPLNSRGNGAGACDYCHDDDGLATPVIRNTSVLHHGQNFDCRLCHLLHGSLPIRECERCHGPDSLHSIQADSPNTENLGTVVVGGEDAGYGHVGRDAGPGDSDCWGCHGFGVSSSAAPLFGPVIPMLYSSDPAIMTAGKDATVVLSGEAFTNSTSAATYESNIRLTAADGSSLTLQPDVVIDAGKLAVTIPGGIPSGNYKLQAVKDGLASNPAVITVVPTVTINRVIADGTVMIVGSGFGGYAEGSGTSVTGSTALGSRRWAPAPTEPATIVSWSDTEIVADFGSSPTEVTVNSLFGSAAADVEHVSEPGSGGDSGGDSGGGTGGDTGGDSGGDTGGDTGGDSGGGTGGDTSGDSGGNTGGGSGGDRDNRGRRSRGAGNRGGYRSESYRSGGYRSENYRSGSYRNGSYQSENYRSGNRASGFHW